MIAQGGSLNEKMQSGGVSEKATDLKSEKPGSHHSWWLTSEPSVLKLVTALLWTPILQAGD